MPASARQRFWSKVDKNGPVPPHAPELGKCWLWTAGATGKLRNYGGFWFSGQTRLAHRLSWEMANGPAGNERVFHQCKNHRCVNHHHLARTPPVIDGTESTWANGVHIRDEDGTWERMRTRIEAAMVIRDEGWERGTVLQSDRWPCARIIYRIKHGRVWMRRTDNGCIVNSALTFPIDVELAKQKS